MSEKRNPHTRVPLSFSLNDPGAAYSSEEGVSLDEEVDLDKEETGEGAGVLTEWSLIIFTLCLPFVLCISHRLCSLNVCIPPLQT